MDEREDTLICTDHEGGNHQDAWMSGLGGGETRKGAQMSPEWKGGRWCWKLGWRRRLRRLRRARPHRGHSRSGGIHGPQRSPQKMAISTSTAGPIHGQREEMAVASTADGGRWRRHPRVPAEYMDSGER
jgi:hypothetical protein